MKKIYISIIYLLFYGILLQSIDKKDNKFIIITDLEPDDRIALHVLAAKIPKHEILFVGTTLKNAARKKALTRKLLDQLQLQKIPVYQGLGSDNAILVDHDLCQAARYYDDREGQNILSIQELDRLKITSHSSLELQYHIRKALKKYKNIQFVLLASPTDLVAVLKKESTLKKNIKHIYIQGGWAEYQADGETILRTTYNWNMDPKSSAQLLSMNDIAMTVYSSHMIKSNFRTGRCNIDTSPTLIALMNRLQLIMPSLQDQEIACLNWDEFVIAKFPMCKKNIERYQGKQFTHADPLVMVGIVNNKIIESQQAVDIFIDLQDFDPLQGFRVYIQKNPFSKIQVVESVNSTLLVKSSLKCNTL